MRRIQPEQWKWVPVAAAMVALAGCGSTAASTGGGGGGGGRGGRGGGGGLVPVVVGRVVTKDVPVDIPSIGNVEAYSTISVRSQITGTLQDVRFKEGDFVKAGQLLFTIDERPYKASLDQAQATLARDKAMLIQAQAQLDKDVASDLYNTAEAKRMASLHERGLLPRDQSEQQKSAADAATATVAADKASIEGAQATLVAQQATVESAQLQLDYCRITAPIDGHTGNLAIKSGNLVTANSTELITITQITPVYVTFSVPAVHLDEIKQHASDGSITVAATPQTAGGQTASGKLTFIDNAVDPTTDTIKLKATFPNTDRALWPGQFARVSVRVSTISGATVAPSEAVQTGQDGQFVFLVKQDQTVEQRPIKVGQTVDQDVVITAGLRPGDQVVTEGQLRLEPGTHITRADPKTGEVSPNGGGGRGGRGGKGGGRRGDKGGGGSDAGAPTGQPANGQGR